MKGIKAIGVVRNPSNKNYIAENPVLELRPILNFAGGIQINGEMVELDANNNPTSRNGFTIENSSFTEAELADLKESYDSLVSKCKAITVAKFKELNPNIEFTY
ncbi:MAG: hypothetical protein K9I36_16750 [Bacteroidia bacterium]|nr:hypothetical protein [Bacteroidia bacterium]